MTKPFPEVISGIRTAKRGVEVREDIAQMGEYVEQFAATATEKAEAAASSEKKASDAVANIDQQTKDAVAAVNTAETKALQDVETARTGTLTDIGNARIGAVRDVTDTKTAALTALEEKRAAALQEMQASVEAAAGSAEKAAASEGNAKESETKSKASADAAAQSEVNSAASESAAQKSAEEAAASAALAGTRAGTDKTLSVEDAPADAKTVGNIILDRTKDTPEAIFYSKAEVEAKIKELLAAQRAEDYAKIKFWISPDPTSPAELFGGTWERIEGKFILGASDTYPAGSTGGEAEVTLIEDQLPVIDGTWMCPVPNDHADSAVTGHAYGYDHNTSLPSWWGSGSDGIRWGYGYKFGGGMSHNNLPPYYSMYIWRRVDAA